MDIFKNVTLFHAKMNGDIDGDHFRGNRVFFSANPDIATAYAEHCADNELLKAGIDNKEYQLLGITVFPVLVTFDNPAITDRHFLFEIGRDLGIDETNLSRFADNFEDSNEVEREAVFSWLQQRGHDSAILPNDSMPVFANGDWELQTSYVSFTPEKQVRFKISGTITKLESANNIDIGRYKKSFEDESAIARM